MSLIRWTLPFFSLSLISGSYISFPSPSSALLFLLSCVCFSCCLFFLVASLHITSSSASVFLVSRFPCQMLYSHFSLFSILPSLPSLLFYVYNFVAVVFSRSQKQILFGYVCFLWLTVTLFALFVIFLCFLFFFHLSLILFYVYIFLVIVFSRSWEGILFVYVCFLGEQPVVCVYKFVCMNG